MERKNLGCLILAKLLINSSELVDEVVEAGDFWLESLSGSDAEGDLTSEGL